MSQEQKILAFLKSGRPLTPLQALRKFGCLRLGARIFDIQAHGTLIKSKMVKKGDKHVAQYRI